MPESHKAEKKRIQKANREAGIGDEAGRIVRVKDEKPKGRCTVCQQEIVFTRTNTEAKAHAEGKHGSTMDVWSVIIVAARAGGRGAPPLSRSSIARAPHARAGLTRIARARATRAASRPRPRSKRSC